MRGSAATTALWNAASAAAESAARKAETATNQTRLDDALADFDIAVARVREAIAIIATDRARNERKLAAHA